MNTYGENSNTDLLHMYGYVEQYPENIFDCVEIPTKCFTDAYNKLSTDSEELMNKKIEIFKELDFIDDNMSFIVGVDGIVVVDVVVFGLILRFIFDTCGVSIEGVTCCYL